MTDQEVGFSDRFARPNRLKIAAVAGASLAIVLVAAVTMGASPAPTGSTGAAPSASPSPSGNAQTPGGPDGPKGRFGDFGGLGRHTFAGGPVREAATITAIDASNLSLKTDDGWTRTIDVTGTTEITKGGRVATLADLEVGDQIRFRQSRAADGSYTIDAIDVVVPTVVGVVTGVDSSSITITERDGTSRTIATTGSRQPPLSSHRPTPRAPSRRRPRRPSRSSVVTGRT